MSKVIGLSSMSGTGVPYKSSSNGGGSGTGPVVKVYLGVIPTPASHIETK